MPVKDLKIPKHPICLHPAESNNLPPQLPPRNFAANDVKDSEPKSSEQACKSLSDTYLMRLQQTDLSTYGHICNIGTDAARRIMTVLSQIIHHAIFLIIHSITCEQFNNSYDYEH